MLIFAQGWSIDKDGPGQRLVFYLKGCNMRCAWCANPESISPEPEILFYPGRSPVAVDYVCPYQAVSGDRLNRKLCRHCPTQDCVKKWKNKCFELAGKELSSGEILRISQKSRTLFAAEGGVTFGGGEPTMQTVELAEALRLLHDAGIHTVVESNAATSDFKQIVGMMDLLICDFKIYHKKLHRKFTGIDNQIVMNNLKMAAEYQQELKIRVPLITTVNDNDSELKGIAEFLRQLEYRHKQSHGSSISVEIIPLHHLGEVKYRALNQLYPMVGVPEPGTNKINQFRKILADSGILIRDTDLNPKGPFDREIVNKGI